MVKGADFIGIILIGILYWICRKAWKSGYKEGYEAAKRECGLLKEDDE